MVWFTSEFDARCNNDSIQLDRRAKDADPECGAGDEHRSQPLLQKQSGTWASDRAAAAAERRGCTREACKCYLLVVLPVLAAALVFVPWFGTRMAPDCALLARVERVPCLVMAHEIIDVQFAPDNAAHLREIPGLGVRLDAPRGPVLATALPHLLRRESWMDPDGVRAYFDLYPAGSTATCYYDPRHPADHVAMSGGIGYLAGEFARCALTTVLAACLGLFVACRVISL